MINFVVSLGKPLIQILDEFENFTNKLKIEPGRSISKHLISCCSSLVILMYHQTIGINKIKKFWKECNVTLFSQFGLHQMINNLIHILDTYSSNIDLIFLSQLNFTGESRIHPSLHSNCHCHIVFVNLI